jgi:hypothetical protein
VCGRQQQTTRATTNRVERVEKAEKKNNSIACFRVILDFLVLGVIIVS